MVFHLSCRSSDTSGKEKVEKNHGLSVLNDKCGVLLHLLLALRSLNVVSTTSIHSRISS